MEKSSLLSWNGKGQFCNTASQSVRREGKAWKGRKDLGNWLGEVSACQDK